MRSPRALVVISAVSFAAAGCGATSLARAPMGFTSIPHLTKITESRGSRFCSGYTGTDLPAYCQPGGRLHSTRGFQQLWEPRPTAQRLRVPSQVVVDVFTTSSAAVAKHFSPVYAHTEGYIALPRAGVNGGIAAKIDSLANNGRTEFRFAWTSGRSMVEVNVIGPGLTVSDARNIARRASPS